MAFDWTTFALEIINFLVLVWILKRFLYQPVLQTIARRKAAIEQSLADAKAKQADTAALEHQYRDRLSEWEKEKQALRARADEEVNAERTRRMASLQAALDEERAKRHAVEQRQMHEWRNRIEDEAVRQGAQFAGRLLARVAGPELEARLVALALEDLGQLTAERLQVLRAALREAGNTITVTSAFPLAEPERRALLRGIAKASEASPSAEFAEDKHLLAGLRVKVGPWVMQANLQDELTFFAGVGRHEH